MAVNKNFVIKNGIEVRNDLIVGDPNNGRVGIATTTPRHTLHVNGGIGATDVKVYGITTSTALYVSGIGTIATFDADLVTIGLATVTNLDVGITTTRSLAVLNPTAQAVLTVGHDVDGGSDHLGIYYNNLAGPTGTGGTATVFTSNGDLRFDVADGVSKFIFGSQLTNNLIVINGSTGDVNVTGIVTANTFSGKVNSGLGTITTLSSTNATLTNIKSSGISTLGVTTTTQLTAQSINSSGIVTAFSLSIGSTQVISNTRQLQNIVSLDATTTATIESAIANAPNTFTDLKVTGVSTLGTVLVSSGVVTATSGIVTYYGDGQYLSNVTRGVGIGTTNIIGFGATVLYFQGPGISTVTVGSGIGTINVIGSGGGATIGIGTTVGDAFPTGIVTAGNLWYNSNVGRLFIYYQDSNSAQWVDAAPFNTGVISGNATFDSITVNGNVYISGIVTATDFDALSDIRYKENIHTVNDALSKVTEMRGVRFDWKESGLPSYGVIAQELQEVLPELVHGSDPKTVNYNGIIGVLIEAIKDLKAEIEELKKD